MISRLAKIITRLRGDGRGIALTEFAIGAPVFLVLVLGSLETANMAIAYLRVSQMAMTVADNAGRVEMGIDEANIYEVFAGAEVVGDALDFEPNGRIVLYSLEDNGKTGSDQGQVISWQRCWGELEVDPEYGEEGDGEDDASLRSGLGNGTHKIAAAPNTALMFVEATYDYQPILSDGFFDPPRIRYESAFHVHGRVNNQITNTQNLPVLRC